MLRFKRIALTVKSAMDQKEEVLSRVIAILQKEKVQLFVDKQKAGSLRCIRGLPVLAPKTAIDAVVTVGGDGTILRAVRQYADREVPFITINRGTLGFLAELPLDSLESRLPELLHGKGTIEVRGLLHSLVRRGKKIVFEGVALNEAVIAQGAISRLIQLDTEIDGEVLTTFDADGLIVATPTGSTAYSLAAGGPIVHPHLSAVILTPINPHSFSQKPLVLPSHKSVRVKVDLGEHVRTEVGLSLDGQQYFHLENGDVIDLHLESSNVRFLRCKADTFVQTLRTKLKWGEGNEGAH